MSNSGRCSTQSRFIRTSSSWLDVRFSAQPKSAFSWLTANLPFGASRVWADHAEIAVYYFELVVIQTEFKSSPSDQFPSDHSSAGSLTLFSVYLGFQVGVSHLSLSSPGHILIHTFFPSTSPALHPASRDGLSSRA